MWNETEIKPWNKLFQRFRVVSVFLKNCRRYSREKTLFYFSFISVLFRVVRVALASLMTSQLSILNLASKCHRPSEMFKRIEFMIGCLVHQSLSGWTPTYLAAHIQLAVDRGRQNLQIFVLPLIGHASYHGPTTLSVTGVFLSLDLVCGTVYLQIYDLRCNSGHSGDNSKQ